MKFILKILICALLSFSVGIACASPLLVSELNIKPYPGLPEGPKADTSISVVYANFTLHDGNTIQNPITGSPADSTSMLDYEVVINVTNVSDFGNQINRLDCTAAEDIYAVPAVVGFFESLAGSDKGSITGQGEASISTSDGFARGTQWGQWSEYKNGQYHAGGDGLVKGVWLDGEWVNVTWIPGTSYPQWPVPSGSWFNSNGTRTHYTQSDSWPTEKTIPPLPQNATTEGTWIEGVPILQMQNITVSSGRTTNITTSTAIFVNGTWVDVTGRVKTANQELYVRATNTVLSEMHYYGEEPPTIDSTNYPSPSNDTYDPIPGTHAFLPIRTYTDDGGFNNYWAPHESRLIVLNGTREVLSNWGLDAFSAGKIWLLAQQFNQVQDTSVNCTALYTNSTSWWLNQVPLQRIQNSYIYSTLADKQTFVFDKFGVEAFIKQES
jgi:hypothetical protein